MSQENMVPVPTNIITGSLGVGKTSYIRHLLKRKPSNERWAVLVNEFGEIGIDGGLLNNSHQPGVYVKEVPGGCMCCTAGLSMQIALNRLLKQAKPHRLIIEPTGLGHPHEVLATLQAPHYHHLIEVKATFALVDARNLLRKQWREQPIYMQQIQVADVIVMTKSDLYQGHEVTNLKCFVNDLHSLTPAIIDSANVELGAPLLDQECHYQAKNYPQKVSGDKIVTDSISQQLLTTEFVKMTNQGGGFSSFGWAFSSLRSFKFETTLAIFQHIRVNRLKAILITDCGVFAFNIIEDELSYQELDESNDSRLEFICEAHDEAELLAQLLEKELFCI